MSDQLDRIKAALSDRYAVSREIGSGGMATVYQAQDLRHDRQVAIKVLRTDLALTLGPDRFHREIKIAAQLQHPHILPLLDSGDAGGFLYYVMPYVEGQSLRDKMVREGELPIVEAVRILRDVVDALTEAHSLGVVHRDIKPENILLRGRHALVTDFGVAKAVSEATGREQLTTAGVALGTPAYMAPEQASASPYLDHRVDIYAIGAVAYELLTGRPVFMGTTPQMVLGAHMTETPDPVTRHRETVPAALEAVVMRCLEKKPADRWQTAEELLPQLEALSTPSGGVTPTTTQPVRVRRAPAPAGMLGVAAAVVAVVIGGVIIARPRGGDAPVITFGQQRQVTLEEGLEMDPALSPDGRFVAYAAGPTTAMRLYVRPVTGGNPVVISEGVPGSHRYPRWSPDGSQVLFTADNSLWSVPPLGGSPRNVMSAEAGGTLEFGSWSPDGTAIAVVESAGGVEDQIVVQTLDRQERLVLASGTYFHSTSWSPDGRFIAFVVGNHQYWYGALVGNLGPSEVWIVPADGSGEATPVTGGGHLHGSPTWMPDGRTLLMVSTRDGGLDVFRVTLDDRGRVADSLVRITTGIRAGAVAVSADGSQMAYSVITTLSNVWAVDISGRLPVSVRQAVQITRGVQHIEGLDVSADGRWLVYDSDRGGNVDIYKQEVDGGEPVQLTTDPADDFIPAISPDGEWVAFHSWRTGSRDVFVVGVDGTREEQVTDHPAMDSYAEWSPDGRSLVLQSEREGDYHLYTTERSTGGWSDVQQLTTNPAQWGKWSPAGGVIVAAGLRYVDLTSHIEGTLMEPFQHDGARITPRSAAWFPDGSTIVFKAIDEEGRASFWLLPASGGQPQLAVRFDDPTRPSGRGEFSTDGRRIYFTIDDRKSDLWLMDVHAEGS